MTTGTNLSARVHWIAQRPHQLRPSISVTALVQSAPGGQNPRSFRGLQFRFFWWSNRADGLPLSRSTEQLTIRSVREYPLRFRDEIFRLRQNFVLEFRVVRDPCVKRADPADRCIQVTE